MRQRQSANDPAAEVADDEQADRQQDDDDQADREDKLDLRRHAVAEAPETGRQAQEHDREEVEDALDEDRAEGEAQRTCRC